MRKNMKKLLFCQNSMYIIALSLFLLAGCSSKEAAINFKVHTEPEGAHIVYRMDSSSWIYLGTTPLNVVETVPSDRLEDAQTIALRAMRQGYLEQLKEWPAGELEKQIEENGMILWTPRLVKDTP